MDAPAKINPNIPAAAGFEKFLVDNGFVAGPKITQIHALQQQTGQDLGQLLLAQKVLEEEDLAKARAAFFNIPYVDLRKLQVPASVLSLIPSESAAFYNWKRDYRCVWHGVFWAPRGAYR